MRKAILLSILLLLPLALFAGTIYGGSLPFYGYYDGNLTIDVSQIQNTRFNMTSDIVQIQKDSSGNPDTTTIQWDAGFNIGFWSFYSDYTNTNVYFTISPLKNGTSDDVMYYLQIAKPDYTSSVITFPYHMDYFLSDGQPHPFTGMYETKNSAGRITSYSLTDGPLFVKMAEGYQSQDLQDNPEKYPGGLYTSTVTIEIVADDTTL